MHDRYEPDDQVIILGESFEAVARGKVLPSLNSQDPKSDSVHVEITEVFDIASEFDGLEVGEQTVLSPHKLENLEDGRALGMS